MDTKEQISKMIRKDAKRDIKDIISESKKNSTSYKINIDEGTIKFYFSDKGKDTTHKLEPRRDKERYQFRIKAFLEDSSDISEIKGIFYDIIDDILPDRNASVSQDYPSGKVEFNEYLTEDTVNNIYY